MAIEKTKMQFEQKLLKQQQEMEKEFAKKREDLFTKVNTEGTSQTKFVQDLALKMLEKAPKLTQIGG